MNRSRPAAVPSYQWLAALTGLAILFTIISVRFATGQSVWTDESTQLSGLTLGFFNQLRWLTGHFPQAFSVPPDRMPPFSYWLGNIWIQIFGSDVLTIRYLSVFLSIASVLALWTVARQCLGVGTAFICAALLALSPNFIVESAEIRAYAAFILFSILLIYAYLRLLAARTSPSTLDFWFFAVAAALCSCTHYFGVVISAGAFFCAIAIYLHNSSPTQRIGILHKAKWPLAFYSICCIALFPFIFSAIRMSGGGGPGVVNAGISITTRLHDFIKLIYRLFGHQSMLGIPGLSAASLVAGVALLVAAAIPGANERAKQLLLFLIVNFILIAAAGLTTSAFGAFAPSYNVWALPVIAFLSAAALTHRNRRIRLITIICLGVLLAADCYAASRLFKTGELYGHTRSTAVKTLVDSAGPSNSAVVYVNDAAWSTYFALVYDYEGKLAQYIATDNFIRMVGAPPSNPGLRLCGINPNLLLLVVDQQLSADELQFYINHPGVASKGSETLDEFIDNHRAEFVEKWNLVSHDEYLAQSALSVIVFKRRLDDTSLTPTDCKNR